MQNLLQLPCHQVLGHFCEQGSAQKSSLAINKGHVFKHSTSSLTLPQCQIFIHDFAIHSRGGVETQCFETETRLWGSGTERRKDFGVSRPRRDTRIYINCFGLSQGCRVRDGSWSRMFFVEVGTEILF